MLGLVGCIAAEFPDGRVSGDGFAGVLDLVERNVVRILDLEFVTKRADDSVAVVAIGEVDGVDPAVFDGASSGVLELVAALDATEPAETDMHEGTR